MLTKVCSALLLINLTVGVHGRVYIKEKPDFFNPCSTKDSDFNNCSRNNIQNLLLNWKDGLAGVPAAGKLDPLKIKKMKIDQNQFFIEMSNVSIRGLSSANITEANINLNDSIVKVGGVVDKLRIDADYKTSGRILFLALNGNGRMWLEIENITISLTLKTQLTAEEGLSFIDVHDVRSQIKSIGNLRMHFENLFNGNKELEASTDTAFNENWRDFLEPLLPTVEQTIDVLVLKKFKKVFNVIPLNYLISDAPTKAAD